MAYSEEVRKLYQDQIKVMREAGILKEERFICSPQAAEIEVEFPAGSPLKKLSICVPITIWDCRAIQKLSRLPMKGLTGGALACLQCALSAAPRISTGSSKKR